MGIILSALAAAGDAGVQSMNQNIEQQNRLDQMAQQNQNETERDKARAMMELQNRKELLAAELKAKSDQDESNRTRQVENIENAKQGIIDRQLNKKYGEADANVEAAANGETDAPLSAEQQAVYDQAKQADRDRIANSRDTLIQAGIDSGYIGPKDVMQDTSKNDLAQLRAEISNNKNDAAMERKKLDSDTKLEITKMWIANGGGGGGKSDETATIKTAKAIQADEKSKGRDISLAEALDLTKKASDQGNTFAMNYARTQTDLGKIGADPKDPTKPAPGKSYATFDDALQAGRKNFVGGRGNSSSNNSEQSNNAGKLDSMFPKKK